MSPTTGLGYALARGAAVGIAAVCVGLPVRSVLSSRGGGRGLLVRVGRRSGSRGSGPYLAWALLLVPFLTPVILVGYAYSGFSLSLIRRPGWNEALYDALLLMKLVPVAALVLHFAPRSLSPEALHCRRLLGKMWPRGGAAGRMRAFLSSVSFWARAEGVPCAAAFTVVFLLAFGEFEMASLLVRPSWTVQLFDAQAGGLALGESLRLAVVPALVEGAVLVGVLALLFRGRGTRETRDRGGVRGSPAIQVAVWSYLVLATLAVSVVPAGVVLRGTVEGFAALWENFVLGKDIAASVAFALAAAFCAYLAAGMLLRAWPGVRPRRGKALFPARLSGPVWRIVPYLGIGLALPGLMGALVVSLVVLAAFQLPGLRLGRETILPVVIALALLLMPFALLLRALLRRRRPGEALHAAELLRSSRVASGSSSKDTRRGRVASGSSSKDTRRGRVASGSFSRKVTRRGGDRARTGRAGALVWRMSGRRHFWVVFLLFFWAYFDMTASSLLAPVGTTTVFARLYNLMHYGQSQVLSAMVCLSVLVPVALLGTGLAARRPVERFMVNG